MQNLVIDNPVFATYVIVSALLVIKIMGQGWMTVYRMIRCDGGLVSPEDLRPGAFNKSPDPAQLEQNDYVERSRRMHRNDLENIPGFWAAGLIFVAVAPPLWLAQVLMYGFLAARLAHSLAYATRQSHETRATLYTIGSLIVIYMALHVLAVMLF